MSEIEAVTALHTIQKPKKIVRDEEKPEQQQQQAQKQKPKAEPEPEQNDTDDGSQHIDEMV